jgi:hypothetical protein
MFCRTVRRPLRSLVLCVTVFASACHGKEQEKPPAPATAAAPGAPDATPPNTFPMPPSRPVPTPPYELTPPPGYRPVTAPAPLTGAWEAPTLKNGFTPTLNLAHRPRTVGTPDEAYAMWRDELMGVLKKQYQDVTVMAERPLPAGSRTGKLIIVAVTLPIPGGKIPMTLFTYGVVFTDADALWVLGAITSADLDAQTGNITPSNEPEILSALASFRTR